MDRKIFSGQSDSDSARGFGVHLVVFVCTNFSISLSQLADPGSPGIVNHFHCQNNHRLRMLDTYVFAYYEPLFFSNDEY